MSQKLYNYKLYTITALTNLHPGSGDANYGVVDNLIQRDPIDELPVIHSSSIKGSLREFVKFKAVQRTNNQDNAGDKMITALFGSSTKEQKEVQAGSLRFLEAFMIGLPVRANDRPYYIAIAPTVIKRLLDINDLLTTPLEMEKLQKLASFDADEGIFAESVNNTMIEDEMVSVLSSDYVEALSVLKPLLGDVPLAMIGDKTFKTFCTDLPVIARNQLENGVSKNLFYEQVLPRQTKLAFVIGYPSKSLVHPDDKNDFDHWISVFNTDVTTDTPQIGANASIGYGVCKIEEVPCLKN